jgi:hypothetical protein
MEKNGTLPACDDVSGVVYTNTAWMFVQDGQNPSRFTFVIKVRVHGGNEMWFPSTGTYEL